LGIPVFLYEEGEGVPLASVHEFLLHLK